MTDTIEVGDVRAEPGELKAGYNDGVKLTTGDRVVYVFTHEEDAQQ